MLLASLSLNLAHSVRASWGKGHRTSWGMEPHGGGSEGRIPPAARRDKRGRLEWVLTTTLPPFQSVIPFFPPKRDPYKDNSLPYPLTQGHCIFTPGCRGNAQTSDLILHPLPSRGFLLLGSPSRRQGHFSSDPFSLNPSPPIRGHEAKVSPG